MQLGLLHLLLLALNDGFSPMLFMGIIFALTKMSRRFLQRRNPLVSLACTMGRVALELSNSSKLLLTISLTSKNVG